MNKILMVVLLAAQLLVVASANVRTGAGVPGGELRIVGAVAGEANRCPLRHTDVRADISGFVARVNVVQEFANLSTNPVEAIYTFPLPDDAAVDQMTMIVGGRRINGLIKRKEEARALYEAAKSAGKTAALLDQERPNIFTQAIANILPGEKIIVAISYVNILHYDEGGYEFSFPMTIGPRYAPTGGYSAKNQRGAPSNIGPPGSSTDAVVHDADKIAPPIAVGMRAGHDISLSVHLDAGVPLGAVHSMLHTINVTRTAPSVADISLASGSEIPNRDFILKYHTASARLQTALLTHAAKRGDAYFTLIFQPPASPPPGEIARKEMVFVIDQTGSQSGWPIEKAKETMRYCINHLNRGDTFQLLGFNTELYPCFPKPVQATPAHIARALKFLAPLEGEGGTDILKSVKYALTLPDDPARLRIVCYMTDGFVGNDMQIVDYIRNHRGRARMFPFGVGNSVNRFLINEMAKEGGDVPEYVTLGDGGDDLNTPWDTNNRSTARPGASNAERRAAGTRANAMASSKNAAQRFYERIAQPVLLNPQVDWHGLPVTEVYDNPIADVFTSSPIILKGRYTRGATGRITISGILRGVPWSQTLRVNFPSKQKGGSALPSLWARERIAQLQAQDWMGAQTGNPNAGIKSQIIDTALRYRLMSQYTSFVAVENKVVNPGGNETLRDVSIELGEGLDPNGFFSDAEAEAEPASASGSGQAEDSAGIAKTAAVAALHGSYRVASGTTFAGRSGDPLITVEAPSNAQAVIAVLPGGDIKNLRFNTESASWEARFDIPTYAPEGDYIVQVVIVPRHGVRVSLKLHYRVSLSAPRGNGQVLLHQQPCADNSDAATTQAVLQVESGDDISRVVAILPWGARVPLLSGGKGTFTAIAAVPDDWRHKPFAAHFILTDSAHNRTVVSVDMAG